MSLFRQRALEQRRLPEPSFTPVVVVSVRHWLWLAMLVSLLSMVSVWLIFGRLYTTYNTILTVTGSQAEIVLPADINLTSSIHAVAQCPQTIRGLVMPSTGHTAVLQLDAPVQAECHITLILHEASPLERLFP